MNHIIEEIRRQEEESTQRVARAAERSTNGIGKAWTIIGSVMWLILLCVFAEAIYYKNYDLIINMIKFLGVPCAIFFLIHLLVSKRNPDSDI